MKEFPVLSHEQVQALAEVMEKGDNVVVYAGGAMAQVTVVHDGKGQNWYWGEAHWNKY